MVHTFSDFSLISSLLVPNSLLLCEQGIFSCLQVAFRAKVGKKYQLPHKGIIPEEFGVVCCILL